jgi:hypothetical protein
MDRLKRAPIVESGVKKGWGVDIEYLDGEGRSIPKTVHFSSKTGALNFIAWECSKLFPEGNEDMLLMSKEDFQRKVGWNVNRVWAYEVRHFLEEKKFRDVRELCQEFLRLYDLAHPEAKGILKIALHWSFERLPNFKDFPNESPVKNIYYDATNKFEEMLPLIKRMAVLPPVRTARSGLDIDAIEIDTDAELQGLGVAEILSAGGENIYVKQDGLHYFAKIYATDKFGPGMHDFSEESFEKVTGNKVYSEFSDDGRMEFFVVKCAERSRFDVKWLDAGDNYSLSCLANDGFSTADEAIGYVHELLKEYLQPEDNNKRPKMGM